MYISHVPPSRTPRDSAVQPLSASASIRLAEVASPAVTSRAIEPEPGTSPVKPPSPGAGVAVAVAVGVAVAVAVAVVVAVAVAVGVAVPVGEAVAVGVAV